MVNRGLGLAPPLERRVVAQAVAHLDDVTAGGLGKYPGRGESWGRRGVSALQKNMGDDARQASGVGRCCRAVSGDRHVRLSASPREPLRRLTGGPAASTSAQAGTWPSEPRSSRGPPDKGPGCPGVGGVLRVGASRVLPCSRCALVPLSLQRWPSAPPRQGPRPQPCSALWRCPTGRSWALCLALPAPATSRPPDRPTLGAVSGVRKLYSEFYSRVYAHTCFC